MEKATYLSTAETDYRAFLLLVENGHNNTTLYGEDPGQNHVARGRHFAQRDHHIENAALRALSCRCKIGEIAKTRMGKE